MMGVLARDMDLTALMGYTYMLGFRPSTQNLRMGKDSEIR